MPETEAEIVSLCTEGKVILTIDSNGIIHISDEFISKQPDEIAKEVCKCIEKQWNAAHEI